MSGSCGGSDNVMRNLEQCRAELDSLDADLIRLLARRLELGLEAARIKRAAGMPILDSEREAGVIDQARQWAREAGLSEDEVGDIFRRLVSLSGRAQLESNLESR